MEEVLRSSEIKLAIIEKVHKWIKANLKDEAIDTESFSIRGDGSAVYQLELKHKSRSFWRWHREQETFEEHPLEEHVTIRIIAYIERAEGKTSIPLFESSPGDYPGMSRPGKIKAIQISAFFYNHGQERKDLTHNYRERGTVRLAMRGLERAEGEREASYTRRMKGTLTKACEDALDKELKMWTESYGKKQTKFFQKPKFLEKCKERIETSVQEISSDRLYAELASVSSHMHFPQLTFAINIYGRDPQAQLGSHHLELRIRYTASWEEYEITADLRDGKTKATQKVKDEGQGKKELQRLLLLKIRKVLQDALELDKQE